MAGHTPSRPPQPPIFRAGTDLALVRFQVVRGSHYVDGLKPTDIRLLEDGRERPVEFFEGGCGATRSRPIDIALLFDISGSVMDPGLLDRVIYRRAFIDGLSTARTSVYAFSDRLWRVAVGVRDPDSLENALQRVMRSNQEDGPPKRTAERGGYSWVCEALAATAREPVPPDSTHAVVLPTDGRKSTTTQANDVEGDLLALGVSVFPVLVGHANFVQAWGRATAYQAEVENLSSLARQTGGRTFDPVVVDSTSLSTALAIVSETIRCEYVVGVSPAATPAPRRAVRLHVTESPAAPSASPAPDG